MQLKRKMAALLLAVIGMVFMLVSFWWEDLYMWVSIGIIIVVSLLFLIRFENRRIEPRELVLLAVLASIAAVVRIPFASIPSVQPTTFVIMMSGLVFGAESGLIIGSVAALASNMILGQGPWTPWQMLAWGLVGWSAGLLQRTRFLNNPWGKIIFGALWGFLFGWIMNLWGLIAFTQQGSAISLETLILYFGASALFDSFHALSNVIFLLIFGNIWVKNLSRFKRKYGLLE